MEKQGKMLSIARELPVFQESTHLDVLFAENEVFDWLNITNHIREHSPGEGHMWWSCGDHVVIMWSCGEVVHVVIMWVGSVISCIILRGVKAE